MKIAYVITRADAVGGATIHVRDLARAMREAGHDPLILTGGSGPAIDQFEAAGVPVHSLRYLHRAIHPVEDLLALSELTDALRDAKPDLVSAHTAKAGWLGRAAAARLGLPAIYTPHGLPVANRFSPPLGLIFTVAERAASSWGATIVCVSESERRLALARGIAPADRLFVVHNGVRDIAPEYRADTDKEPVRLCTLARLDHPKDFPTLITALSLLKDQRWTLDLVGEGPLEPSIRHLAEAGGIAGRVRLLGYLQDPAPVLARSQIFVLASRSEALPRSILEAMRAGLPVVASDVGGVSEAVAHRESGLLVPPQDPASLAAAIGELQMSPALRRQFGDCARATFELRFRLEHTVEKMQGLYAMVAEKKRPPMQADKRQPSHPQA